jgi:hypothetical protein
MKQGKGIGSPGSGVIVDPMSGVDLSARPINF